MTDLDRLHKVVNGELVGRQCGKTFAKCCELIGAIETTKDKLIICYVWFLVDVNYILPMVSKILKEQNLPYLNRCHSSLFYAGKIKIKFVPARHIDRNFELSSDHAIVDFRYLGEDRDSERISYIHKIQ